MTQEVLDYRRVERAIRFLRHHQAEQPDLEAVAEHVGLSKYHFHRLFRRWAGTTPKRFLQHLTVERARPLLEASQPALDVAHRSGLSGGGRLHDHFVQVEAATPGDVARKGAGLRIRTGVHGSPFGDAWVAATRRGICFLAFLPTGGAQERRATVREVQEELRLLWPRGEIEADPGFTEPLVRAAFSETGPGDDGVVLPLHLRGTNFQLQVWRALLRIPTGDVASYKTVAEWAGHSGAARAVGGAVAANPVSFLIPCHRVIRSDGAFGSYRWGADRKRAMLGWEASQSSPDDSAVSCDPCRSARDTS